MINEHWWINEYYFLKQVTEQYYTRLEKHLTQCDHWKVNSDYVCEYCRKTITPSQFSGKTDFSKSQIVSPFQKQGTLQ